MEVKKTQIINLNSSPKDWNQYLAKLCKDNGHEPDLNEELTDPKFNDTRVTVTPYYRGGDL